MPVATEIMCTEAFQIYLLTLRGRYVFLVILSVAFFEEGLGFWEDYFHIFFNGHIGKLIRKLNTFSTIEHGYLVGGH